MSSLSSTRPKTGPATELQADFVRNTQHELKTPATLIYAYASLLVEGSLGPLSPAQQKAAEVIAAQATELKALVERLSQLLILEAGQHDTRNKSSD
jgi:signal transduction histidine kinase